MSNETTLDDVLAQADEDRRCKSEGQWLPIPVELYDQMRAALAGWQPIETAPEDEDVLTWHDFGMRVQNPNHPDYGKVGKPIIQQRLPGGAFPSDICGTGRATHWKSCGQPDPTP